MFELRDYQQDALSGIWRYWREDEGTAPLVVVPTGGGKSVIIAEMIRLIRRKNDKVRILMVSHVKELVVQNLERMRQNAPDLSSSIGIMTGPYTENRRAPILCGTIQTVINRKEQFEDTPFDLMIVDEAHLIPTRDSSQYRTLIAYLRSINPNMRLIGFTATPFRLDSGYLHQGADAMFDGVAADVPIKTLIDDGRLVTPRTTWNAESMDVTKLKTQAGEYTAESQDEAIRPVIGKMALDALKQGSRTERDRWLWFFPSVESAQIACDWLEINNQKAVCIHGGLPAIERDDLMRQFSEGEVQHCTNVNIMTTGIDIPAINHIVLARATKSTVLYIQMCGRGLRPYDGKDRCVILDYGKNAQTHGTLDRPRIHEKGKPKDREPAARQCKACGCYMESDAAHCPECGYIPPPRKRKINLTQPFRGEMVSWLSPPHSVGVRAVNYEKWEGKSGFPTVRVRYALDDGDYISEWLCPEHPFDHVATKMFSQRWRRTFGKDETPPVGVQDCIERLTSHRLQPLSLTVGTREGKEWPDIMSVEYAERTK